MADQDDLIISISTDLTSVKRQLSKLVGDVDTATSQISRKWDATGKSIDKSVTTALQSRIDEMVGIGKKATNEWNGALADQGKALDTLRAKYSPLFSTVKQYQAAQADIRTLYRSGKIGVDEYTAALSKQRQAALANIAAIKGVPKAQNDNGSGNNSYVFRNIAQQVNQIGQQGAATGNYLQALAIQLPDILGAFGSLPAILAGGALAVGGSFLSMSLETKKLDDVLADHEKVINRVVDAYGGLAEQAAKAGTDSKQLINALGSKSQSALAVAAAAASKDYFGDSKVGTMPIGGRFRGFQATTTEFQEPLAKLRADLKAGTADFDAFYEVVARKVEANPSLAKSGNDVIALSESLKQASDAMKQYQRIRDALFNDVGPNGQLLSHGTTNTADAGNLALYQSQQRVAIQRSQQAFQAELASINARSPADRVSAARAGAAAQYPDESVPERHQRIDQAGARAQAEAERQISDAQRDRSLSLQKLIDDQQFEISLLGKTSAEADVLRKAYDLTSQIRIQSAKDGTQVDEKEIETIRQKAAELGKLQQAYKALSTGVTSRGFVLGSPAEQDFFDYTDKQRLSLDQGQESFNSQVASLRAKTSAQRVAAARQAAAAQHPDESAPERDQRINNAGLLAQEQINKELADADRERSSNLKKLLEDQKQDIALIGKTGGAAAAATQQYQQMAQLRSAAAKQGITDEAEFQKVFAGQIDVIKRTAASYGELIDTYGKLKLNYDLSDKARMRSLSPQDQQITTTLRQYGLSDDLNSPQAAQIKKSLQIDAADDAVKGFLTSFRDATVSNGGNVGKAFADAVKTSFLDAMTKAGDAAIQRLTNSLVNALFGGGAGGGAGAGAAVGAVGSLFGGGKAPVVPVTRAALPAVGSTDIAAYVAKAAAVRGIDPTTALNVARSEGGLKSWNLQSSVMKNGVQEQSFGPFQLYKGGGLGNAFQKQTGLDPALAQNGPAGVDFALDHAAKNGWGSWYGAKNSGISNWQGIGSVDTTAATKALDKLAGSAGTATQGLGKLGQLSTNFFPSAPSAPSGGGGLGWLGSLFGGAFKPNGAQASAAASGSIVGLFADGGHVAGAGSATSDSIPAWLSNGEFVVNAGATKKNKKLLEAINGGKVARFATGGLVSSRVVQAPSGPSLETPAARGSNGGQPGVLQVQIHGASGDDHVRTLVKQGVSEGLSSYNDNQVRGGFGSNQNRWTARRS